MKIYFLFILFVFNLSFSQEKTGTEKAENKESNNTFEANVLNPLQKNQLYFEKVFLHINKTSYLIDDTIWFKAYVGDSKNNPSGKTSRLKVNLLNSSGKIIESQNIFIHKGTGKGQFVLNDSLQSGIYYVQAFTNYMRNFGEQNTFIQEITILNTAIPQKNISKNNYDVQLFPEGGYLLEDTENILAVKALLNGAGCSFTGKILNEKKQEIAHFKSEYLGMTKCSFFYKTNEIYTAEIKTKDTLITIALPNPQKTGLIFSAENTKPDVINLNIRTNKNSLSEIKKSSYKLLFHQRNQIIDYFEIPELQSLNYSVELERKNFFEGVNTITLFKNNQPVAERIFYNKTDNKIDVSLEKGGILNDSVVCKIKLDKAANARLSVSVLPLSSLALTPSQNIKSAYLLSPYVKGFIEDPGYYFSSESVSKNQHLDLLLLTQGWTQYTLEEMISDLNPVYQYDFEAGIKLTGKVYPLPTNQLALLTEDDHIIDKIFLNGKKDFSFNNLLLYNGDRVKISFVDDKNEALKPENLEFDVVQSQSDTFKYKLTNASGEILNPDLQSNFYKSGAIKLEEVNITAKNKKYIERKKIIQKYRSIVFDIGKYYDLEIASHFKSKDLRDFLSFDQDVKLVNWNGTEYYLETGIQREAALYIDGKQISSGELSSGLSLKIEDIANILVQPIRGNKIYQVFTTENYKKDIIELFKEYVIKNGFNKEKKYYSPIYNFDNQNFSNLTEIDWKPDLTIENNTEASFNVPLLKNLNGYLFSIQGFTSDGRLISKTITFEDKEISE